ncbi:transcription initiation factor TFIID subunit 9B-like isoform X2 [Drosophila suzukii]|uniref:Transcription initiation factor TFIID subunit 9B-like isoform X2 n=1 Tax=Drosophila suzukii TaxID=28584 RepID=A0ABM4TYS2_DROSZ
MDKKTNYKLCERNVDLLNDLEFVDKLVKDLGLEAEPQARGVILDLAYTLARDKLVEAKRFATLANRSTVSAEDLEMAQLERTDELKGESGQQAQKVLAPSKASPPMPSTSRGLSLPIRRHCQVGKMANLKDKGFDQAQTKPKTGVPSSSVARGDAPSGASSSSSRSVLPVTSFLSEGSKILSINPSSTSAAGRPGAGPPVFKKPRLPK